MPADNNAVYSTMIRAGNTTYFMDVKEAKNGKRYLSIRENRNDAVGKKQRSTISVFSESIEMFKQALDEAVAAAQ